MRTALEQIRLLLINSLPYGAEFFYAHEELYALIEQLNKFSSIDVIKRLIMLLEEKVILNLDESISLFDLLIMIDNVLMVTAKVEPLSSIKDFVVSGNPKLNKSYEECLGHSMENTQNFLTYKEFYNNYLDFTIDPGLSSREFSDYNDLIAAAYIAKIERRYAAVRLIQTDAEGKEGKQYIFDYFLNLGLKNK